MTDLRTWHTNLFTIHTVFVVSVLLRVNNKINWKQHHC